MLKEARGEWGATSLGAMSRAKIHRPLSSPIRGNVAQIPPTSGLAFSLSWFTQGGQDLFCT